MGTGLRGASWTTVGSGQLLSEWKPLALCGVCPMFSLGHPGCRAGKGDVCNRTQEAMIPWTRGVGS